MFNRRKDTVKISDRNPVFHVRYIGSVETHQATGRGCSYAPVQKLWDNSPGERHLRKVSVQISPEGIWLRDPERPQEDHLGEFRIEDISFCNTDRAVNERIFSWICRHPLSERLDCHAVLCSTQQKAQTMAVVLARAFQIAYKDWRTNSRNRDASMPTSPAFIQNESTQTQNLAKSSNIPPVLPVDPDVPPNASSSQRIRRHSKCARLSNVTATSENNFSGSGYQESEVTSQPFMTQSILGPDVPDSLTSHPPELDLEDVEMMYRSSH